MDSSYYQGTHTDTIYAVAHKKIMDHTADVGSEDLALKVSNAIPEP